LDGLLDLLNVTTDALAATEEKVSGGKAVSRRGDLAPTVE
jgi:hypothetical protein